MKCPYCNSQNLVWDYNAGYIVCSECGAVLEPIYFPDYLGIDNNHSSRPSVREALFIASRNRYTKMKLNKMSREVRLYEQYSRRKKKNLIVNIEAIINEENRYSESRDIEGNLAYLKRPRIYVHIVEPNLIEYIEKNRDLVKYLELIDQDPVLSSRTLRGKVALALIARSLIEGREIPLAEIATITGLSKVHVRRLVRLLKERFEFLQHRIQIA